METVSKRIIWAYYISSLNLLSIISKCYKCLTSGCVCRHFVISAANLCKDQKHWLKFLLDMCELASSLNSTTERMQEVDYRNDSPLQAHPTTAL